MWHNNWHPFCGGSAHHTTLEAAAGQGQAARQTWAGRAEPVCQYGCEMVGGSHLASDPDQHYWNPAWWELFFNNKNKQTNNKKNTPLTTPKSNKEKKNQRERCKPCAFTLREKKEIGIILKKKKKQKAVKEHGKCIMAWICQVAIAIFRLFSIQTHHFWKCGLAGQQLAGYGSSKAREHSFPDQVRKWHSHSPSPLYPLAGGTMQPCSTLARGTGTVLGTCVWYLGGVGCIL